MAAQVDPLRSRSFRAFRPWRRREASPGQGDGLTNSTSRASSASAGIGELASALRHATSGIANNNAPAGTPLSSSSLSPSPPSTRSASGSSRRSRTRLFVSAPTLSVSASSAPSYLHSYPPGAPIVPRPGPGTAYTYSHTARPAAESPPESPPGSPPDDVGPDSLGPPEDSQPDVPGEAPPPPPSTQTKPASSSTDQPTAKLGRQPAPSALSGGYGRPSLKRRRVLSDVDGPNTGVLCCKKRRLRRFLITSRLSQPFSQPASHILNRESVASGDKRFLKLAAIMNARRIRTPQSVAGVPPPPEAVWRAAMANRFRKRIFADTAMGRSIAGAPMQLMYSARLAMVPVATAASMAAVRASGVPAVHPVPVAQMIAKPAMIKSPLASAPPPPAAPPAEEDYPRPSLVDDEGDCAFPTTEHESRYEVNDYDDEDDRPDDEVYADFSVLFGSAGDDTDWGSGNEEGLDDYMDELDGIAHLPR